MFINIVLLGCLVLIIMRTLRREKNIRIKFYAYAYKCIQKRREAPCGSAKKNKRNKTNYGEKISKHIVACMFCFEMHNKFYGLVHQ